MKPITDPARVMLAMDEDAIAALVQQLLIARGHRVETASHVQDVADAITARHVDVVLMDNDWVARLGAGGMRDLHDLAGRRVRFIYQANQLTGQVAVVPRSGLDIVLIPPFTMRQLAAAIEARSGRRRYQPNIQSRGLSA